MTGSAALSGQIGILIATCYWTGATSAGPGWPSTSCGHRGPPPSRPRLPRSGHHNTAWSFPGLTGGRDCLAASVWSRANKGRGRRASRQGSAPLGRRAHLARRCGYRHRLPSADRVGRRENRRRGQPRPVAPPGARVPVVGTKAGPYKIRRRRYRGEVSDGMLCSPAELGWHPSITDRVALLDESADLRQASRSITAKATGNALSGRKSVTWPQIVLPLAKSPVIPLRLLRSYNSGTGVAGGEGGGDALH